MFHRVFFQKYSGVASKSCSQFISIHNYKHIHVVVESITYGIRLAISFPETSIVYRMRDGVILKVFAELPAFNLSNI